MRGPLARLAARPTTNHMTGMAFARAAFWRQDAQERGRDTDEQALRRRFWRKLRAVLARVPFAEDLLAAYYCAFDRATPLSVKATLLGAIAYFVLPTDAIPDVLPVLGFTDDAAFLAAAIRVVAGHITPEHRYMAKEKLTAMTSGGSRAA